MVSPSFELYYHIKIIVTEKAEESTDDINDAAG